MYKSRLQKWGLSKNTHLRDVAQVLYEKGRRDVLGKTSEFTKEGKEIDITRILAYVRRKKLTERDLIPHVGPSTTVGPTQTRQKKIKTTTTLIRINRIN